MNLWYVLTYINVDSMDVVKLLSFENNPPTVSWKDRRYNKMTLNFTNLQPKKKNHLVENSLLCFFQENAVLGYIGPLQALETPDPESGTKSITQCCLAQEQNKTSITRVLNVHYCQGTSTKTCFEDTAKIHLHKDSTYKHNCNFIHH